HFGSKVSPHKAHRIIQVRLNSQLLDQAIPSSSSMAPTRWHRLVQGSGNSIGGVDGPSSTNRHLGGFQASTL
ncbi:hypothetical protein ACLKMY_39590, partial [Paraburkholderia mimosarum]|uniref:hypothetical protein n=1 Tax=Paraburkholderia mimosarum TaxID=312026 RepID=UPI001C3F44D9